MKMFRRELLIDVVIYSGIFKFKEITLFPWFTSPKTSLRLLETAVRFYLVYPERESNQVLGGGSYLKGNSKADS